MAPRGRDPVPDLGAHLAPSSVPQLWAADRSPFPLAGHWTAWGGDGPSPPSPVQVPEGDTHKRNFGPVPVVPAGSAPVWSRGEGAASDLLLLLLLQTYQRAPAGRATPLTWLQSRVDTKTSDASPMELWSLRVCWLPLDVVLGYRPCSAPSPHGRAEDECGCASSLPHCPPAVIPLPLMGAGRGWG